MPKVVHFEIPADDLARAKEFYSSVFDWKLQSMDEMDYTIVQTTDVDDNQRPKEPGAINGGMFPRTEEVPTPVITIDVESIDDALKGIEGAGGTVVKSRTPIPGMGAYAYFKDTEGNLMGLWETTT